MMPLVCIDRANSSSASSRNRVRGWYGLGSTRSMSISCGPWRTESRAGTTAALLEVAIATEFCKSLDCGECSGSRMSAPSPRPKAFLGIGNHLLGELCITIRPFTMHIIENNRLTETWCLGKPNISRNDTLEYLRSKKATQIRCHLARQCCPLVEHCKQNSFDLEARVEGPADAH